MEIQGEPGRGKNCFRYSFQDFHSLTQGHQVSSVRIHFSHNQNLMENRQTLGWGSNRDPENTSMQQQEKARFWHHHLRLVACHFPSDAHPRRPYGLAMQAETSAKCSAQPALLLIELNTMTSFSTLCEALAAPPCSSPCQLHQADYHPHRSYRDLTPSPICFCNLFCKFYASFRVSDIVFVILSTETNIARIFRAISCTFCRIHISQELLYCDKFAADGMCTQFLHGVCQTRRVTTQRHERGTLR